MVRLHRRHHHLLPLRHPRHPNSSFHHMDHHLSGIISHLHLLLAQSLTVRHQPIQNLLGTSRRSTNSPSRTLLHTVLPPSAMALFRHRHPPKDPSTSRRESQSQTLSISLSQDQSISPSQNPSPSMNSQSLRDLNHLARPAIVETGESLLHGKSR